MKKINVILVLLSAFFMNGCATTYKELGRSGGYHEIQLDENIFKVTFSGNGYTSMEMAKDFALLRSAELTIEKGYKYFSLIDNEDTSLSYLHKSPTYYNTNVVNGSIKTSQFGGHVNQIVKPNTSNTILCFKYKPKDAISYNAIYVIDELRKKYKLKS